MIKKNKYPFVSIVTPNYNGEKYLEETIKSIINQTSHDYEFILVDGKSTDNSLNIIKKYLKKINIFISEKDKSMYHAIDKGISKAKGEVIIWINSDDLLHKKAVQNVSKIFKKNPEIDWISGINGYIKKNIQFSGIPYIYPKFILSKGYANHAHWGFVQQESISFRKKLYKKSGGFDYKYKNSCDFGLWKKFSTITTLHSVYINIGFFRSWEGQDSKVNRHITFKSIGMKKIPFYSFRYIRNLLSLILLPYILIKTYILTK